MFRQAKIEIYKLNNVDVLTTSPDIPITGPSDWKTWFEQYEEDEE